MKREYTELLVELSDKVVEELKKHNALIANIVAPAINKSLKKMSEEEAKSFILYVKDLLITECKKIN